MTVFVAEVLPPVRGAEHFGPDVAGLVHDRLGAVAGIFDDLALLDEDHRRAVVVAVPRHDAAGLDRQLAEAQLAILDMGGLHLEIDRGEYHVGHADRLVVDRLAALGFILSAGHSPAKAAGAAAIELAMMVASARPCQSVRESVDLSMVISSICLVFALAPNDLAGYDTTIVETSVEWKCRLAFVSIALRYARSRMPEHVADVGGKRRGAVGRKGHGTSPVRGCMPLAWLPGQDERLIRQDEMPSRSQLDSRRYRFAMLDGYRTDWATAFLTPVIQPLMGQRPIGGRLRQS